MADLNARIIAKASATASEEPQASDLEVAELAVNTADGKLFTKHTDGSIVAISGGGGGAPIPSVRGTFIESDSTASTSEALTVPTHVSGDLLVAVLMHRDTLTPPSGFTLHGTYLASMPFGQRLSVCTKVAGDSEPASYTWTQASAARICGWMASVGQNATITSVTESYGNAETATITTNAGRLNLTAATWLYSTTDEDYSQSGTGVVEITDSPKSGARISGGYTTSATTVTSTHESVTGTDSPNHAMINIALIGANSINDNSDVDTSTTPPTDGQALVWDNANSEWKPGDVGAGGLILNTIDQATDVSTYVATDTMDARTFNASWPTGWPEVGSAQWAFGTKEDFGGLSEPSMVVDNEPAGFDPSPNQYTLWRFTFDGNRSYILKCADVVAQDSGARYIFDFSAASGYFGGTEEEEFYAMRDEVLANGWNTSLVVEHVETPADGQVLTWVNANNQWEPQDAAGGATVLNELTDVTTNLPVETGQYFLTTSFPSGQGLMRIYKTSSPDILQVNKLDGSANDWSANLAAIKAGDTFELKIDGANPYTTYTAVTDAVQRGDDPNVYDIELSDAEGATISGGPLIFRLVSAPTDGQVLTWVDANGQWEPADAAGGGGASAIDDLSDVDTSTTPPTDGQALVWDNAASEWKPGTVSGGGGATELGELSNVETRSAADTPFSTGFETGEPQVESPAATISTSVFRSGSQSITFPAAQNYGNGGYLQDAFKGNEGPRYDVVRMFVRSTAAFDTNNRQSLGGTKNTIGAGGGWTIYTRDTGFSFYADGSFYEAGTKPSMVADTWYEIVYVLDWANGRDVIPASFSLWVDGALAVNNVDPGANGVDFTQPANDVAKRFYFMSSSSGSGTADRFVDDLQTRSVANLSFGMSDASVDAAAFFAATYEPTADNSILRYDLASSTWQAEDLKLSNIDEAGYTRFLSGGDPNKPYAQLKPDDLSDIFFGGYQVPDVERWSMYANETYGPTFGRYHKTVEDGGNIADGRLRANEARRTFYSSNGILHNLGDQPLWLVGALGNYTDNTPELRWTSGDPGDSNVGDNGKYVGLKLPVGLAADTTYTFPLASPTADKYMAVDGTGQLYWTDPVVLRNTQPFSVTSTVLLNNEGDGEDLPTGINTSTMVGTYPSADAKFGTGGWTGVRANAEYLDLPLPAAIGTRVFTFEFWYKSSDTDYDSGTFRRIFAPVAVPNDAQGFQIFKRTIAGGSGTNVGNIEFNPTGADLLGTTGQAIDDGQWHHIVFQHEGSGIYSSFLDGVETSRITRSSGAVDFALLGGIRMGGRSDLNADAFFEASIDGVALYQDVNRYTGNFNVPTAPPVADVIVTTGATLTTVGELADVDTSTTPPTDGQVLTWVDANGQWEPADAAGGAVDSVNGETGAVVLDLENLDNVGLAPGSPSESVGFYDNDLGTDYTTLAADGDWTHGGYQDRGFHAYNTDANGKDMRALWDAAPSSGTIYWSNDGSTWTSDSYNKTNFPSPYDATAWGVQTGGTVFSGISSPVYISLNVDPSGPVPPLAVEDGQVLTWVDANSQWQPADYISKATLKAEVAASTDFADFQSRIAAL